MPGSEVPLRDELQNLQHYLEIVHIRFAPKFQSQISVEEAYMDCRIGKLSIQPIVENSVKYAVEPRGGNAIIAIRAFEERGDLVIEVADNGNGFSADVLQRLSDSFQAVEEQTGRAAMEESVGIINVHARMVLNYGSPYGVTIRSVQGEGSVVALRFPKKDKPITVESDKNSVQF
jgi:two-component system sensor histidine kinase YesM